MPHGGNDRDFRFIHRVGDQLFVEGPKVFDGAAAASDDQHVRRLFAVELLDRRRDLRRGQLALHLHGGKDDLCRRETAFEHSLDVMHRRARGRGHNADALRKARQRLFVRLIEQAHRGQLFLALFKRNGQRARAVGLHILAVKLIDAVALKKRNIAADDDAHPVFGQKAQPLRRRAEHHRPQRGAFILERKIKMSRAVMVRKVGDLTGDIEVLQIVVAVDERFYISIDLRNS